MPVIVEARDERLALGLDEIGWIFRKGDDEVVRPGFDGHAKLQVRVDPLGVFVGAGRLDRFQCDALAVDQHLDLVRFLEALDLLVTVAREPHLDFVVPILRENVGKRRAATRADRQALDVLLLRDIGRNAKRVATGCLARRAEGEAGDFLRGGNVAVEQRGREIAHRDVVEAVARFVVGQQRGGVDVEREEIADGVLILSARETAKRVGAAGVGLRRGGVIECGGDARIQLAVSGFVGPLFAHWRHLPVAEFPENAFPEFGVGGGVVAGDPIEHEPAFLRRGIVALETVFFEKRRRGIFRANGCNCWGRDRVCTGEPHQQASNRATPTGRDGQRLERQLGQMGHGEHARVRQEHARAEVA